MHAVNLVSSNVRKITLGESQFDVCESQNYVYSKPVLTNIPSSVFLRLWKPVALTSLVVNFCLITVLYFILFLRPIFSEGASLEPQVAPVIETAPVSEKTKLEKVD